VDSEPLFAGTGDAGMVFEGLVVEDVLGVLFDGPASLASRLSLI